MGLSRPLFGFICFSWCIGTIIIGLQFSIRIGNQKEELKYCSFYDLVDRKSPTPSENRVTIWSEKAKVCPGIRTRPARTESHCSTACATTMALGLTSWMDTCRRIQRPSSNVGIRPENDTLIFLNTFILVTYLELRKIFLNSHLTRF